MAVRILQVRKLAELKVNLDGTGEADLRDQCSPSALETISLFGGFGFRKSTTKNKGTFKFQPL